LRKVLYLVRRTSVEDVADLILSPAAVEREVEVTIVLLEGAENFPFRAHRVLRLASVEEATGVNFCSKVPVISHTALVGEIFASDKVVVL
jgi:hypothetical protein